MLRCGAVKCLILLDFIGLRVLILLLPAGDPAGDPLAILLLPAGDPLAILLLPAGDPLAILLAILLLPAGDPLAILLAIRWRKYRLRISIIYI